jgi:hypothetical protein
MKKAGKDLSTPPDADGFVCSVGGRMNTIPMSPSGDEPRLEWVGRDFSFGMPRARAGADGTTNIAP